jgi:glycosyltransferase involved in cell wall biosynthesis
MHEGALIGAVIARILRVPLIFDFQGGLTGEMVDHGFLNPEGSYYPWVRRLEKFICHLPDAILTSSHRAKGILTNEFNVPEKIIYPLPDCVDTERFNPSRFNQREKLAVRQKFGIPEDRPIVAYLGLLADYQGTPELIKTAAHLCNNGADVHFLIMGYPNVEHYSGMCSRAGISDNVTFTGKVDYEIAPKLLSIGDMAVSTKMSKTEGSGKVLNYMAMAQPVAAFETPVHREYLGDLGRYAPIRDTNALAKVIADLIQNPDEQRELGKMLRQRAIDQFEWKRAGSQISDLYEQLVD